MPTGGYQIRDQHAIHFITFAMVEWVDVFTRKEYVDIVLDSLRYCQEKNGLQVHAWCIMSNHLHLILSTDGTYTLSDVLRDFKKYTSSRIIQAIEANERESRRNWMLWIFRSAGKRTKGTKSTSFGNRTTIP